MGGTILNLSVLGLVGLASLMNLYKTNDIYTSMIGNNVTIMNIEIDSSETDINLLETISIYLNQNNNRKVFLFPSYDSYENYLKYDFSKYKNYVFFAIITPKVSNVEDYTSVLKDYNTNKYDILKKIDYLNSNIFAFVGYRGYYYESKIK